jgi:hypothetical protein
MLGQFSPRGRTHVSIRLTADAPIWTAVHEIGHWMDWEVLATDHILEQVREVDGQSVHEIVWGGPASTLSPLLDPWRAEVLASSRVRALQELRAEAPRKLRARLDYLLRPSELLARSYTQWALMGTELAYEIAGQSEMIERFAIPGPLHWMEQDFAAVASQLEWAISLAAPAPCPAAA